MPWLILDPEDLRHAAIINAPNAKEAFEKYLACHVAVDMYFRVYDGPDDFSRMRVHNIQIDEATGDTIISERPVYRHDRKNSHGS